MRLQGVFAATVAPFDEQGRLLEDDLHRHVIRLLEAGIDGIMANGHTGEILSLAPQERERVVRVIRAAAGPGITVIGGVHGQSTWEAKAEAAGAISAGADVALVFSPFSFNRGGMEFAEAVTSFYREVSEAAGGPIMAMQYPVHSNMQMPDSLLAEVVKLPGVVGIKQACGDIAVYDANRRTIKAANPSVAILTASEGALFPSYALGCDGSLIGFANIPSPVLDLHHAFAASNLAAARAAADRLHPLARAIYALPSFRWTPRLKGALHELGWISTPIVRGPSTVVTDAEREKIRAALSSLEPVDTA